VFSFLFFCSRSAIPVASLSAGPLADVLFEPLLRPGGALASSVGAVIGVGKGRGSGLLLAVLGLVLMACAVAGLFSPRLRRTEREVPDHDTALPPLETALAGVT
jgi:drug/metabolite transporter (DMT)-like permease